jgi:hypothetical protein
MATKSAQLRVLEQPVLLNLVFEFADTKEWLFLGAVSKAWAAMYQLSSANHDDIQPEPARAMCRKVTSYRAAAASLRRALYACNCNRIEHVVKLVALSMAACSSGPGNRRVLWQLEEKLIEALVAGSQHSWSPLIITTFDAVTAPQWLATADLVFSSIGYKDRASSSSQTAPRRHFFKHHDMVLLEPTQLLRRTVTSCGDASVSLRQALYACKCGRVEDSTLVALSRAASASGSIDVLIWARAMASDDRWVLLQEQLCVAAAAGNQLSTLQWLCAEAEPQQLGAQITTNVAAKVSQCADLAMLQWACEQRAGWARADVLNIACAAAAAAAVEKLNWLRAYYGQNFVIQYQLAFAAIDAGAVSSLQWLATAGLTFNKTGYTDRASRSSQFAALQYLIEVAGCPWQNPITQRRAAASGDAAVLEWLRQADVELWNTTTLTQMFYEAAMTDNLTTAKWLRAQGAEWPPGFLYSRASELKQVTPCGLRTMQWVLASGCPWWGWSGSTCVALCSQENTLSSQAKQDAITFAHAAGCPCYHPLHHLAAWLQHGKKTIRDVSMPKRRRWHAPLFRLCYGRTGDRLTQVAVLVSLMCLLLAPISMCYFVYKKWQQH